MTSFGRGDVILVEFIFSDESGRKVRPALVISTDPYHRSRREVVVAAITSNTTRELFGDHLIRDWQRAGLLRPSVVTGIIRTIARSAIDRRLGAMAEEDIAEVTVLLCRSLGL